ncbi:MAG: hypothetical protein FWC40_09800 [Proteobacteria bacterium]|nr:hypothetical protein [Pseudomonadota bacterium]
MLDALMDHAAATAAIMRGDDPAHWQAGYCGSCGSWEGVVDRGSFSFCIYCFEISKGLKYCKHCGMPFTGYDFDHYVGSDYFGCPCCEGYVGHLISKND